MSNGLADFIARLIPVAPTASALNFDITSTFEMLDKEWLREFMRSPQFDDAQPNNNAQYMESLQNHNSHIRRSRWGSYVPENYKVPED